ncbi:hypothetical protein [Stenotrophobium rhamnosiphilum]|uniref:Uncharacterized protein n=1 Tax=Stenotrophobium rhamnosiphilum TaxID=2029166 RepID=A0A2T5MI17_9GAMM|nr:hypothetical protein [Stenotrophobium rhamnosiphilum]PTU32222.1 hypothetical protein CJD38_06065 [Stenotrophobium rhamnosiphilum]
MNRKSFAAAALLFIAAAPAAHAATNAPVAISPVVALLGSLPVLGPTVVNVVGLVGGAVSVVPVAGPLLGGVLGAPVNVGGGLPGLPSLPSISPLTGLLGTLPVVGPTVANVISVVSGVVSPVPVVGPLVGGIFGAPAGVGGNLPGLPLTPGFISGLPLVGPLLEGTLLGG